MLPRSVVIRLANILGLDDNAFLVGGQAFNLWADRYSDRPELEYFGPFVSKDIDYFGSADAARKLARALDGTLKRPNMDPATPNTALVEANVAGQHVEVDFLNHVVGVEPRSLRKLAVEISVPVEVDGQKGNLLVPVMHPLHCMQSRIANVVRLGRTGAAAERQMQASPIVLGAYVEEMLDKGHAKEVKATVRALFAYLKSDAVGRAAHTQLQYDPMTILERLAEDGRLDLAIPFAWRRMMLNRFIIALLMAPVVACSSAGEEPSSEGSQPSTSREETLRTALANEFRPSREEPEWRTSYRATFFDLNEDGIEEAIVHLTGRDWCGSGGCQTAVLQQAGSSYRLVTAIPITVLPIRALESRHNGWRDLGVGARGGGGQRGHEAELRFDGRTYPTNPSTPPAVPTDGSAPGVVLIAPSAREETLPN